VGGTRQRRNLCRVSPIWHSAKLILKIKKIIVECQITGTRQRRKINFVRPSSSFFLSSHSLCLSRRAAASPRCRLPAPPPPRAAASPPRPPAHAAPAAHRRLAAPPRAPLAAPPHRRPTALPESQPPRAAVSSPRHRLPRPPPSQGIFLLNYVLIVGISTPGGPWIDE
jgi:hypothetical protein